MINYSMLQRTSQSSPFDPFTGSYPRRWNTRFIVRRFPFGFHVDNETFQYFGFFTSSFKGSWSFSGFNVIGKKQLDSKTANNTKTGNKLAFKLNKLVAKHFFSDFFCFSSAITRDVTKTSQTLLWGAGRKLKKKIRCLPFEELCGNF